METMSERLEVRLAPSTMARLRDAARRRGTSIGQLVRDAIDSQLAVDRRDRERAAHDLFAVDASVGDWPEMEAEIVAARSRGR